MKTELNLQKIASIFLFVFAAASLTGPTDSSAQARNEPEKTNETPAVEPMRHFEIPAWESLTLTREPNTIRLKDEKGLSPIEFYALKRDATPRLEARLEKDCLVISTGEMQPTDFGNVQMQVRGLDAAGMANRDYCLYFEVQGPKGQTGNFYFEGHTLKNEHFWRVQKVNFNGQRQRIAFDQFIIEDLRYLNLRYDFFGAGEFRLYGTHVELEEEAPSALTDAKPELLFYAPFDGSADAQTAAGEKAPKRAENLKFSEDAIHGQALEFRAGQNSLLEYLTAKNLEQEEGSISVWIKPDWNDPENKFTWRPIVTEPWAQISRIGSGAIWCWMHEGNLRFDTSDLRDKYLTTPIPHKDSWTHIVFCWNRFTTCVYVNGSRRQSFSDSTNLAQPIHPLRYSRIPFESFFVGAYSGGTLQGKLDELRIYSMPLGTDDVMKLYREFRPVSFGKTGTQCLLDDAPGQLGGTVRNVGSEAIPAVLRLENSEKKVISEQQLTLKPNAETPYRFDLPKMPAGACSVYVLVQDAVQDVRSMAILHAPHSAEAIQTQQKKIARESAAKNPWTEDLSLKLLEEIDLTKAETDYADRFAHHGDVTLGELNGRKYLEMPNEAGSRFAVHLPKLEANRVYCFEWDVPDDKMRTVDVIAQTAQRSGFSEYELQTGYCTGDEYPNTGKWLTMRNLFWSRGEDFALVFTTARTVTPIEKNSSALKEDGTPAVKECVGGGAAVASIRIYEVLNSELPVARINPAKPVNGWTRPVGIYFEDPAINYDFGANGSTDEGYAVTLDRLCEYMKFSGQNLLAYPMVWYCGPIGSRYNPRNHVPYFFEGILSRFDREGLEFMGTFNQNNVTMDVPLLSRVDLTSGKLNDSIFSIHDTGTPHPGGWHGTPPIFNTLHPDVQAMTLRQLDDILAYAAKHPSFKGIILHLPCHALHSLGDLKAGYNDFLIEKFEKETGIKIPVDRAKPLRGKLCHDWLMANAKEEWTDWRCQKIAEWYRTLANHLRKARPDLKLGINCMRPILYETSSFDDSSERDFWGPVNREMGIDAKYFADVPNIFIDQTLFPADYRWTETRKSDEIRARLRRTEETAGQYASLRPSKNAWIHHHDRYWESAIGRDASISMDCEWFKEHPWRVSTLNPTGFYAMKHYILPLRYQDVLGFTKGGFLIGTYGMETPLVKFAAAYRALPAVPFTDAPCSTETVKVRTWTDGKTTWLYAVNTGETPAEITIPIKTKAVVDLGRNVRMEVNGNSMTITLDPLSLRSFRTSQVTKGFQR